MRQNPRQGAAEPHGAPKVLGRYRCDERLAGDGWLEIHRARVQGLAGFDRVFAVVSLAPGALTRRSQAAENLLRAARAAAAVKDARIAAISDSGLSPGSAFVATELVHGVSLRALSAHLHEGAPARGLPPGFELVLAHIGAEIAGALAAAHDHDPSLAHGALAPSAVMVTSQGAIKLLGLGLAASVLTPAEIAAHPGRGPFAAPELALGHAASPASDMFALGAMIAALADGNLRVRPGQRPRTAATAALLAPLQPLLAALTAPTQGDRPLAVEAEAHFREVLARSRYTDARGELGALVRATMQAGPHHSGDDEEDTDPTGADGRMAAATPPHGVITPVSSESFSDEPTAILSVSSDGNVSAVASLLEDMRGHGSPGPSHNLPTPQSVPAFPFLPFMGSSFEQEERTVMTSAANLPIPPARPSVPDDTDPSAGYDSAPPTLATTLPSDGTADGDIELGELVAGFVRKTPAVTPPSWQPTGDLEASAAGIEGPGSLGDIEIPERRRLPRTLALIITGGALCIGAAATVLVLNGHRLSTPVLATAQERAARPTPVNTASTPSASASARAPNPSIAVAPSAKPQVAPSAAPSAAATPAPPPTPTPGPAPALAPAVPSVAQAASGAPAQIGDPHHAPRRHRLVGGPGARHHPGDSGDPTGGARAAAGTRRLRDQGRDPECHHAPDAGRGAVAGQRAIVG